MKIETDQFCRCGYNLHGQATWVDERLGLAVCRCPECGLHHPAGQGVTAYTLWLNRMSTMYVGTYVLLTIAVLLGLTMVSGGMMAGLVSEVGRTYENSVVGVLAPLVASGLLAIGMLLATLFWRLRRAGQLVVLLVAAGAPTLFAYLINRTSWPWSDPGRTGELRAIMAVCGIGAVLVVAVGMAVGRPVARWIVLAMLPDRIARALGFLWTVDGKTPPG